MMRTLLFFLCAQVLAGCFVLDAGKLPKGVGDDAVENVIVYNYGWNLFGLIPFVCGNRNADSWCPFAFFRDDVKHEYVHEWLMDYAKKNGYEISKVVGMDDEDVFFDFYYLPLPWIIQYHEVTYSAIMAKRKLSR